MIHVRGFAQWERIIVRLSCMFHIVCPLGRFHTCDLLGMNYIMNYLLNYVLYCTKLAHSHSLFSQRLCVD